MFAFLTGTAAALGAVELPFSQTFQAQDMAVIGLLVILEGVLSIDNALVLGILAKRLPKKLQGRALTYGLVGAFVFRLIAIAMASLLLKWWVVKLLGGGYLAYIAIQHLFFHKEQPGAHEIKVDSHGHPIVPENLSVPGDGGNKPDILSYAPAQVKPGWAFWKTVLVIELTDIAFAIDSILAAIALVAGGKVPETGVHPKLWVIVTGGFLGVILMRFAAIVFIKLLDRFPRFEMAAYLLVLIIGAKLLTDWWFNNPDYHRYHLDFHSTASPAFWVFWVLMLLCFAVGFLPAKEHSKTAVQQG